MNFCSKKSSGTILLTQSNPRNKPKTFLYKQKTLFIQHLTRPRKCEEQIFFLTKSGSKKFHNGKQQQQQRHIFSVETGSQQQIWYE